MQSLTQMSRLLDLFRNLMGFATQKEEKGYGISSSSEVRFGTDIWAGSGNH